MLFVREPSHFVSDLTTIYLERETERERERENEREERETERERQRERERKRKKDRAKRERETCFSSVSPRTLSVDIPCTSPSSA